MYNAVNFRLNRILTLDKNSAKLQDLNYYYDKTGNITRIIDYVYTASQTFRYDALKRLTRAVGAYGDKTYTYDQIGNITRKDGLTYTYGGYGAGPHAVTSTSDGTSYRYDANGNMISKQTTKGKWTYVYDTENRLASIGYAPFSRNTAKPIANYYYDGDGGRVKKVVYRYQDLEYSNTETYGLLVTQLGAPTFTSSTVQTITSVYVGNLYEIEDSANGNPQRKTKSIFLGSTRVAGISFPSASVGNPDISYYHQDHLGSTNVMTDKLGVVRSLTEYDPYGKISRFEKFGDKLPSNWNYFHDKPFDDESGLIYFNARYYDPKLGRFISADTIVPRPENPQEFNRYSYCLNNPINRIDPSGHKSWWKKFWGQVVGAVVGIVTTIATGGNVMLGFQAYSMVTSTINAAQTGNWGGFAESIAGSLVGGAIGVGLAGQVAGALGKATFTFGGGFLVGAVEFGVTGFGAAFGGALGSGANLRQAFKAGAMGGAIGAVTGGFIEGSYAAGWQKTFHGMDRNELGKAAGVKREVSLQVVSEPLPGNVDTHWGIEIKDNYNEYNGVWDFRYEKSLDTDFKVLLNARVQGIASSVDGKTFSLPSKTIANDLKYVTSVYRNIQENVGYHYYQLNGYNCKTWVENRLNFKNDGFKFTKDY